MFRPSPTFDPVLLIAQMGMLQGCFYVTAGFLLLFFYMVGAQTELTLDMLLRADFVHHQHNLGWTTVIAYLGSGLVGAQTLRFVVQRAKKCLDHTATVYGCHLIITIIYNGSLPSYLPWWIVNGAGLATMVLYGEYLCVQQEMEYIPVNSGAMPHTAAAAPTATAIALAGNSGSSSSSCSSSERSNTERSSRTRPHSRSKRSWETDNAAKDVEKGD